MAQPTNKESELQKILDKSIDNKKVFGTSFAIKTGDWMWQGAAGDLTTTKPYYIASTTKLFTTALIMQLRASGQIALDDNITKYLDSTVWSGLHVYNGKDYSSEITIRHLLAHTSGLPDYFQGKNASGKSLEKDLVAGNDQSWTFEQAIERAKLMKPLFAPGARGKAHYSDTNFQLLGHVIETITGKSFAENCKQSIIAPLGLANTYLYQDATDKTPQILYFKNSTLEIPKAMASFGPDGGMVSTSTDMLMFIEAFFTGVLFPQEYIAEMKVWNRIFFPMRSGVGIHLFDLPWIFNPTGAVPAFIGHSGLSGALAYYSPAKNIFVAGTVNQVAYPDISFKTMIKLTQVVLRK